MGLTVREGRLRSRLQELERHSGSGVTVAIIKTYSDDAPDLVERMRREAEARAETRGDRILITIVFGAHERRPEGIELPE